MNLDKIVKEINIVNKYKIDKVKDRREIKLLFLGFTIGFILFVYSIVMIKISNESILLISIDIGIAISSIIIYLILIVESNWVSDNWYEYDVVVLKYEADLKYRKDLPIIREQERINNYWIGEK